MLLGLLCSVMLQSLTPVQLGLVILSIVCQDREEAVGLYYAANNFMSLTFLSQRVLGHFSCFPDQPGSNVFGQRASRT